MEREEFSAIIEEKMQKIHIDMNKRQIEQFYLYMNLLLEWNKKMNLTAITEPQEVITKHFVDCATVMKHLEGAKRVIDVGSGAGFPGIPIKILKPDIEICLMDSLQKRISFLEEVIQKLRLEKIETIHARAEELGRNKAYREQFDATVSRAVAPLNVLLEYVSPFLKVKGKAICMKGSNIEKELKESEKAFQELKMKLVQKEEFKIPETDLKRSIVIFQKENVTPKTYPRKPGTPKNRPIA